MCIRKLRSWAGRVVGEQALLQGAIAGEAGAEGGANSRAVGVDDRLENAEEEQGHTSQATHLTERNLQKGERKMDDEYGQTMGATSPAASQQAQQDDDLRTGAPPVATRRASAPSDGQMKVEEEAGQVSPDTAGETTPEAEEGIHEEVSAEAAPEGAEEGFAEATPEQLAVIPPGEESAYSDLQGIEGQEEYGAEESQEVGAEAAEEAGILAEAGTEAYGQPEFLPILAGLASTVVPMLVSKVGPILAKQVIPKLSQKALAVLKRHRKGTGVVSVIARLLESAEQQPAQAFAFGGESTAETVDEAVVEETAQMIETIIGADDRVRITHTTRVPWRHYCALRITFPSGATYRGTGFFIGPRAVATAGHCVYMHSQGGWARRIQVIPGANGTKKPFKEAVATSFRSTKGWVQNKKPESDYGCILVPTGSFGPQSPGSFGFAVFPDPVLLARRAVVAGYPGDKPFAELWGMGLRLKAVTPKTLVYDIDTMGGQSGAPVYIKQNGKRYVVGIHNYGATSGNSATRITANVYKNLDKWRKL